MKNFGVVTSVFLMFLFGGVSDVKAGLTYGSGFYTNLCDSGTAAKFYSCDAGCNPALGSCQSKNNGVVKWVCDGKWDQCLASESGWDSSEDFGGINCGTTVQLSLFDKKCRRDDGSWDNSCKLLGYMVWYSGDCAPGFVKTPISTKAVTPTQKTSAVVSSTPIPTAKPTTKPTVVPTAKVIIKPTISPTVLPTVASKFGIKVSPTSIPTRAIGQSLCGKGCKVTSDCEAGFVCNPAGLCRNPACIEDTGCFCGQVAGAVAVKSPETGESSWWGAIMLLVVGIAGLQMRKLAKKVW